MNPDANANTHARVRARIGVLVPYTNRNLEPDLALLQPPGVGLHITRIGDYDAAAVPDEKQMAGLGAADIDAHVRLLAGVQPDVILYGCTSATLTHGAQFDRELAATVRRCHGIPAITAAGALVRALRAQGASRIGFASPYVPAINRLAMNFLGECGIETVSVAEVSETLDNVGQGALAPEAVFDLGRRADSAQAQAIVLSCTDMRSVEIIDRLESALGKPVIGSNQAMMFAALEAIGIDTAAVPFPCGRLLRTAPPPTAAP